MPNLTAAITDFQRARRKADLQQILARLTGQSTELLSYEDVRRKLRASKQVERGLQEVPVDAIVGSVGRYKDFTRTFLPKSSMNEQRWAKVKVVNSAKGLPPVELYKIGEAYFVLDGNHRVSIAREQGLPTIQAYVTEVFTSVPLTPDTSPDDLIIKAQYAEFLERTGLHEIRPEADLTVTAPGKYRLLEEHIEVHSYFMGLEFQREVSWEEAVAHWYDTVYLPTVHLIRERGIMDDFPNRTETDLYIWLAEHRAELEESLGWSVNTEEAVADLAAQHGTAALSRVSEYVRDVLTPDELDTGPPAGEWRRQREQRRGEHLFAKVLVSVGENELSRHALEQAIAVAQREGGEVRGLHVVNPATDPQAVEERFYQRLATAGLSGKLAVAEGSLHRQISGRARWNDLVVVGPANPPGEQVLSRLTSVWRNVLLRSPNPVLVVPHEPAPLTRALLAYNGSPKAEEALFVAAYLARQWSLSLVVLAVGKEEKRQKNIRRAREYLEQDGVSAEYVEQAGDAAINILLTAERAGCDFIIMGGYGSNPVVELIAGSTVDQVMRNAPKPMLICR